MIQNRNGVSCKITFGEAQRSKVDHNAVGCFDKVEVEHIHKGQVIFTDEEKNHERRT